jgi:hypothetical protein
MSKLVKDIIEVAQPASIPLRSIPAGCVVGRVYEKAKVKKK